MFGYVKVNSAELKVKEYEFYRGTYCGLCRSMGKCTGQCSRATLSYDFVFLALVRIAAQPEKLEFEQRRCLAHPLKKRNSMVQNSALDYCAGAAAILNYRKTADDIEDEKGSKKLRALLTKPFVSRARKKALRRDPQLRELDQAVAEELANLSSLEKDKSSGVDAPADCFGRLLGLIMSFCLEEDQKRITYQLGKSVGAWIYIADAIDDMQSDVKKGRYNPFVKLYDGRIPDGRELELIYAAVKSKLLNAESAFDLLNAENGSVENIIANILFLGIPQKTEELIKKNGAQPKEEIPLQNN